MSFDLAKPGRTIHAGVVLMGEAELLDVAPIDLLYSFSKTFVNVLPLSHELKCKALDLDCHWVTEKGTPAKLTANTTVQATDSFQTCPPLDIVLIGAYQPGFTPSEAELAFIRKSYDQSSAFLTICGGILPAQLAGVLVGKTCTAPRFMIPALQKEDPRTIWVEKRFARDGKLWTSGALLNGLDLIRAFCLEYWPEVTKVLIPLGGWPVRSIEY